MDSDDFFLDLSAAEAESTANAAAFAARTAALASAADLSDADVEIALKVLNTLASDATGFTHARFRQIRLTLKSLYKLEEQRFCKGLTVDEYRDARALRKDAAMRNFRKTQLDKQLINTKRLRQQRLDALKQLQDKAAELGVHPALAGVPDGPAVSTAELCLTLPNGEGKSDSQNTNDGKTDSGADALTHLFRACYICKVRYSELHHFYDMLCPTCAPLNYTKRLQTADCSERVAIVTGGRIKIGYHIALKLLRAGARVVVTTRFPHDAIERLAKEPDFDKLQHRILYYGLDLRDLAAVEAFCHWFRQNFHRLDIIVNNACQTIRRPPAFYRHLIRNELEPLQFRSQVVDDHNVHSSWLSELLSSKTKAVEAPVGHDAESALARRPPRQLPLSAIAAVSTQIATVLEDELDSCESFPEGALDVHKQQLDLRTKNSWVLKLGEVSTPEAAEVMAVNALSPFILNGKLRSLMESSPQPQRFIINVSAMEGKFYRFKTPNHPHTNMAKAALNMMTRTSAADYANSGIYMNAVDTGWINDENPVGKAAEIAARHDFQTPIDEVDAAARVLDPVFHGLNTGEYVCGKFFKDYAETEW